MWVRLANKVLNLDHVVMIELFEGSDGRRIVFRFVGDGVFPVWEGVSDISKDEFEVMWNKLKRLPSFVDVEFK